MNLLDTKFCGFSLVIGTSVGFGIKGKMGKV